MSTQTNQVLDRLASDPEQDLPAKPTEEQVETALAESGWAWTRREPCYVISASTARAAELVIHLISGGVRVETVLVSLEEAGSVERAALEEFLARSQSGLRLVYCLVEDTTARLVSLAATEQLDSDLRDSLGSVAAAWMLLSREARALLKPELARLYLDQVRGRPPEVPTEA
jgi:hypothetical protein